MAGVLLPGIAIYTVAQAMTDCGLSAANGASFATEVFMDDFETCKDMSDTDLSDAFKTFVKIYPLEREGFVCCLHKR